LPLEIVADNGKEFCNEIVDTLLKFMKIRKTNTTTYLPQTNIQAEVYNKTIAAYLKTQVLNSMMFVPMMFAYIMSYHRSIRTSPLEVTFVIEPRTGESPNPDLRPHYGEDLGTDMYQRLKICQQLARNTASENNEELIENSIKYFNSKVKPVTFEVDEWVPLKEHNFLHRYNASQIRKW
jgi:hypothetical protein